MRGTARMLIVVAVVVLAAGVAGSTSAQIPGTPFSMPLGQPLSTLGATPPATTTTPGPSTGVGGSLTNPGLSQSGTTVPGTPGTIGTTPATPTPVTPGMPAIDQVVSITRTVEVAAPVNAFTVPAGQQLVITDVLITNPAATPGCGAAVSPAGATPPTPGGVITTAATESGTGLLCVPAQTSLNLALTTGLEFSPGQSVQLGNAAPAAGTASGPLHYHLRGFLMAPSGA